MPHSLLHHHKPKVFFIHIPKTGGSSLSASLRRRYRFSSYHVKSWESSVATERLSGLTPERDGFFERRQALRLGLAGYAAELGYRFITGHIWHDPGLRNLLSLGYRLVTCLRDPVERWYSSYFYNRFKTGSHGGIMEDFETFITSDRARLMGSTYVQYIGGARADADYRHPDAIQTAQEHLADFHVLGFVEDKHDLHDQVYRGLGFRIGLPHRRKSPAPADLVSRYKSDPDCRRAVAELCAPDIQVHEHALRLFGSAR